MGGLSPLLMSLSLKDGKPIKITELEPPKGRRLKDMEPLDDEYYSGLYTIIKKHRKVFTKYF